MNKVKFFSPLYGYLMILLIFLSSCSKEESNVDISEKYYTELAEIHTGEDQILFFTLDHGEKLLPKIPFEISNVISNRFIIKYSYNSEEMDSNGFYSINIYDYSNIFTKKPIAINDTIAIDEPSRAPIKLNSVWVGGSYLNFFIEFDYYFAPHTFNLYETARDTIHGNSVSFDLFHSKGLDASGTFRRNYLSFDLSQYKKEKDSTLTIKVKTLTYDSIQTYERQLYW